MTHSLPKAIFKHALGYEKRAVELAQGYEKRFLDIVEYLMPDIKEMFGISNPERIKNCRKRIA